jgi:hypothetical protein
MSTKGKKMSMDEIEVAKLRWETKEEFRLANLPPWEQPDAPDEEQDGNEKETESEDDEELAVYIGGDCV